VAEVMACGGGHGQMSDEELEAAAADFVPMGRGAHAERVKA
jgi:hypothetical protein